MLHSPLPSPRPASPGGHGSQLFGSSPLPLRTPMASFQAFHSPMPLQLPLSRHALAVRGTSLGPAAIGHHHQQHFNLSECSSPVHGMLGYPASTSGHRFSADFDNELLVGSPCPGPVIDINAWHSAGARSVAAFRDHQDEVRYEPHAHGQAAQELCLSKVASRASSGLPHSTLLESEIPRQQQPLPISSPSSPLISQSNDRPLLARADLVSRESAPATAAAAEAESDHERMTRAWCILATMPALRDAARQHVRMLDLVMERTCAGVLDAITTADGNQVAGDLVQQQLLKIGDMFCQTAIQVVELHLARVTLELAADDEEAADAMEPECANLLVRSTTDLLYDGSSSGSSDAGVTLNSSSTAAVSPLTRSPTSIASAAVSPVDSDDEPCLKEKAEKKKPRVRARIRVKKEHPPSDDDVDSTMPAESKTSPRKQMRKRTRKTKGEASFAPAAVAILRRWLQAHINDPYPDAPTKDSLAEVTKLTYDQVQHWFINARMRYWRPMLRIQQQLLASGVKLEDMDIADDGMGGITAVPRVDPTGSLSDLVSVAAEATPSAVAAQAQTAAAAGADSSSPTDTAKYRSLVPRSARSYMCQDDSSRGNGGALNADLIAASTLALHIAATYQTPHQYLPSHPLHRSHKYKSGGKKPPADTAVVVKKERKEPKKK